ncbi:MAG: N-6 DNA methylase [bacterium]|nr:N-6 DNA methylase [bacterium]
MTDHFTPEHLALAREVLDAGSSEGNVEVALVALLKALGVGDVQVRRTQDGVQPDLLCRSARLLFEVKRPSLADDPHRPRTGGQGDESAYEQIERYVRAIQGAERGPLWSNGESESPWLTVLTDGKHWHAWLWPSHGGSSEPFSASRRLEAEQSHELVAWLLRVVDRGGAKPPVPTDPYRTVFEPYLIRLRLIAEMSAREAGVAAVRARQTQRSLWYNMLEGSGMVPTEAEAADLFVRHTFLVAVARAVVLTLDGGARTPIRPGEARRTDVRDVLGDGFVSWATLTDRGRRWAEDLFDAADGFDWRAQPRDVLRQMYESVIEAGHRKAFGEYYTPDWLAEMVAERVCDPDWCEAAVARARRAEDSLRGVGVLDPACGSGTFLFHAARRICDAATAWTPQQQADIAARLVHGIDIHPVAVEIARATLLRALPATPSEGIDGLRVYQGDGLATPAPEDAGGMQRALGMFAFVTPKGARVEVPVAFARRPGLAQRLRHLVGACERREPLPAHLLEGLDETSAAATERAHRRLSEVIAEEGNGVWTWFMGNHMATTLLVDNKVDRIVANPPWVRMSEIQVAERRAALDGLIRDAGLYAGGTSRSPAAVSGGFDVAALFVTRGEELYLADGNGEGAVGRAAGWVLNRASLTADNWIRFRERRADAATVDLSLVRAAPFSGAHAAVWFTGDAGDGTEMVLATKPELPVSASDRWDDVRTRLHEVAAESTGAAEPSGYVYEAGVAKARAGANLRPHCLVVIGEAELARAGRVRITTRASKQKPWRNAGTLSGDVPEQWRHDAVFSQNVLVGCLTRDRAQCIVPIAETGEFDPDPGGAFWEEAQARYSDFAGRGSTTPTRLTGMLDYQGRLTAQLTEADSAAWTVVYNKSGSYLRAARQRGPLIVNDACYWMSVSTAAEAAYLVAVLNAEALQPAYQATRRSDRDFHTHFWHDVPIPLYDDSSGLHSQLAWLSRRIEAAASAVRDRPQLAGAGQIKVCAAIRAELRRGGLSGCLDELVGELLPHHTT